jgi:hypothetical protein
VMFLIALVANFWATNHAIPTKLFAMHGYSPKVVRWWTPKNKRPDRPAPWSAYTLTGVFGVGCTIYLLELISIGVSAGAAAIVMLVA